MPRVPRRCYVRVVASKKRIEPSSAPLAHNPFAALAGAKGADALTGAKGAEAPTSAPRTEVTAPAPTADASRWGAAKIVVRRERKGRGGKTATRISGLPSERLLPLAEEMKRALGCGASVEEGDLLLLGDLVGRAAQWLRDRGAPRVIEGN